jgi:hypothetical protein
MILARWTTAPTETRAPLASSESTQRSEILNAGVGMILDTASINCRALCTCMCSVLKTYARGGVGSTVLQNMFFF